MSATASLVTGVDFVSVPTRDLPAAMSFYGETLGLPRSMYIEGKPFAEFETGSLTLAVMQSDAFGQKFAPHGAPLALHVDDVAEARAELESKGVEFVADTIDSGVCHQAIFKDPDGNVLDLHHRYKSGSPSDS